MKKMKRLASLALALTLSLSLCASIPALAAEDAVNPTIYTTFEWSWNVKNDMGEKVNAPQIYFHYTNINGRTGTHSLARDDYDYKYTFHALTTQKGQVSINSANATTSSFNVPYILTMPSNIVKINDITFTPKNNLPTFTAGNIKIKFNYYYSKDGTELEFDTPSAGNNRLRTDNLVLFRTETYTGTSDFVVKKSNKNDVMRLPNFKLQVENIAPYPGTLPSNMTGSVFGDGNQILLIGGGAVLLVAFHVILITNRKKKEKARNATSA